MTCTPPYRVWANSSQLLYWSSLGILLYWSSLGKCPTPLEGIETTLLGVGYSANAYSLRLLTNMG